MLRVRDLDASLRFYTEQLGMKLLRRRDYPEGKFTLAFVGYCDEDEGPVIELTHNWDITSYDLGKGYGHIALGMRDIYAACEEFRRKGARVTREPGPMQDGSTAIAFLEDPDGYKVELIQWPRNATQRRA